MTKPALVIFAHVPPPDHGQSRMVAQMISALESRGGEIQVRHVDCRLSDTLQSVGEIGARKALKMLKYLAQALKHRLGGAKTLYYIPGPAKKSAIVRDVFQLGLLRLCFPKVIFHWHAIGQGTWATEDARSEMFGSRLLTGLFQKLSKAALQRADLSICVTAESQQDARALHSKEVTIIPNGVSDPCREGFPHVLELRKKRHQQLADDHAEIRILFLSYGTLEKGLLDALKGVSLWLSQDSSHRSIKLTLAGGVCASIREKTTELEEAMKAQHPGRLTIEEVGFVSGQEKAACFRDHDVFLSASRWESFSLVTIEAMAWGLPLIAALSDGVRDILPAGYPYTADITDFEGMGIALKRCVEALPSETGSKISSQLRLRYEEQYTLPRYHRGISEALIACSKGSVADAEL